jgi:hypothetical protein
MAFRTQKISQMTPKGSDLEATDLIEVSTIESGSYVTRSITGQELIDAIPVPPSGITIGTTAITSGTVGRVLFEGTGNVVQESANLFWDNTNGRLGIGTSSPSTTFAIGSGGINRVNLGLQAFEMYTPSSVRTVFLGYSSTSGQLIIASGGSNDVNFLGGGFKSISTGNFAIGSTTDAGYRLDVNGTARVSGLLTTPAGTNLGGWYLYANGTTNASMFGGSSWVLDTVSGGGYRFRTAGNVDRLRIESSGNVLINTTTDAGFKLDVNGTARVQGALSVTSNIVISAGAGITAPFFNGTVNNFQFGTTAIFLTQTNSVAVASGLRSAFLDSIVWQQSSGTGEFASFRATPTYNTTGTYSGIVRGFHYNPVITSLTGATHRAIETTAGNVIFNGGNVGIGTSSPANKLDVNGTARVQGKLTLGNSTASPYQLNVWGGAIESYISLNNTNSGNLNTDGFQIGLESNGTDVYFINRENGFIKFRTNNLDRFSIFSTGNVGINTTTDAGYKLDVNGTARVQNTITLTGINTPNNANLPLKLGNFTLDVQTTNPNTATGSIITTGAITKTDNGVKNIINVNNAVTSTAANFNTLNGFAFTSTINQTLGTIRGIYIAPTLTASTNFRAIETTAGNVIFGGLPTSSAGLPTGAIWNDAGTLKIV